MNDIIKLILFNVILFGLLYYDKRCGIVLIIFMIIYWITIKSSMKNKLVEGYGFFSNFVEMPQFIKYDFGAVLPTSVQYNSDERGYSNVFSFFKGGGHQGTVKTDNMTKLEETNDLLDKLIDMFDKKQQNCMGEFEKYSECSRECGYGKQEKIYRIIQEKGENGIDCKYKEGKIIKKSCILRDCDLDEKCRYNHECRSKYCDPVSKKCSRIGKCEKNHLYHCYSEDECLSLNKKYNVGRDSKYVWDDKNDKCHYEYEPRTEHRFFGKPEMPDGKALKELKYKCKGDKCIEAEDDECTEESDGCYTEDKCDGECNHADFCEYDSDCTGDDEVCNNSKCEKLPPCPLNPVEKQCNTIGSDEGLCKSSYRTVNNESYKCKWGTGPGLPSGELGCMALNGKKCNVML